MKKIYLIVSLSILALTSRAQCPITINGNTTICNGTSTTLTATSTATSYTWSVGAAGSTVTVNPSSTTTFTVIGSDGVCTDSATVTVTVNATPTVTVNANPPAICMGQQPSMLGASGATTYTWSPAYALSSTTGSFVIANPTTPVNYTVCGTDVNGCMSCNNVFVFVNAPVTASVTTAPATCANCNGAVTANVAGGTAPFTFNWDFHLGNFITTQSVNGLCAGGYTLQVTDAVGCNSDYFGLIPQTSGISNILTTITPAACGQSDGSIVIDSVIGGVHPFNFTFSHNGAVFNANGNTASNLPAGVYVVNIQDSATCVYTTTVTINNSNFTAQLTPTAPGCNICNGAIYSVIIGGTAPYTYAWDNGSTLSSINNLCVGNYQLSVIDNGGCFTSASVHLISPNAPVISVDSINNISCSGTTTGAATISVTGGNAPYTYLWNTTPTQTTNIATGLQSGVYIVTVTDNSGCYSSQSIYIANANNIYAYPMVTNPVNCGINGSATMAAYGGTAPYTYAWSNSATGQSATNLSVGNYTVTATDAHGCSGVGYVNILSQCFNIIKGKIYNDANQNCIQDAGEAGLPNIPVSVVPAYYYGYTDANGDYIIQTPNLVNSVIPYNGYLPYYSPTCPTTGTLSANFTTQGDTISNVNFGYYANPNYFDLSIHPGWTTAYPGSQKTYWIMYQNNSATAQNVLIRFTYDSILQYDSSRVPGIHYPAQHKIEWTFNNVPAGAQWNWQTDPYAYFTVPASTPLTYSLNSYFEILPITGDAYPIDNTYSYSEPITGSHDPNEKTVSPAGNILPTDSVLFYTIHFQNNGNDTAYRVVVVDTLSSFLDPATIIPGAASHPYDFTISGHGVLTWTFNHIMLPDSGTNQTASNGSLNFTVKQKRNNPYGTVIKNTADIYFDYNSAVITNTTVNTITATSSINNFATNNMQMLLYPNPTSSSVSLQYNLKNDDNAVVEIRNILGQLVKTITLNNKLKGTHTEDINTADFANGIYMIKLISNGIHQTQKLVIEK
ncbi:MAG: T9SS type A sorting domain-containing protein [Bacteroidia bacterium]